MVVDNINNRALYYGLGEDYKIALDWLSQYKDENPKNEDVIIPGTDILVRIRPCNTKPENECPFESHKDYIDIHYVAAGIEGIGYAEDRLLNKVSYDEKADAYLLTGKGDVVTLPTGYFMITMPQDAHQPCVAVNNEPCFINKLIVKIKVK